MQTEISNTQLDNAKDLDVVMPMYSLLEQIDNYSNTSGSLYKFCRDNPNNKLADYQSFKFIRKSFKFLENSSSCIDLIFTSQPNLSFESGTQHPLYPNCLH